jgi:hypothetical protein
MLRRRFEPNRRMKGLYKEELHNLYSSPNSIRLINWKRMRWRIMGKMRNAYNLVGISEGKAQLERPRRRWEGNVNMDHIENGCGSVD